MYEVTQKSKENIELKINDRNYLFICGSDSPLSDALQAVKVMEHYLLDRLKKLESVESISDPQEEVS